MITPMELKVIDDLIDHCRAYEADPGSQPLGYGEHQDIILLLQSYKKLDARIDVLVSALRACQLRLTRLAKQRRDPTIWADVERIAMDYTINGE